MSANNVVFPGRLAVKPTQTLPQTATATLFTAGGELGAMLITGLMGLVTVATGATTTSMSLGTSVGAATASIMTSTSVISKAAGTWIFPTATAGVAGAPQFLTGAAFLGTEPYFGVPFLLAPGNNITWTTTGSDTGSIAWYLWYIPIDAGAGLS